MEKLLINFVVLDGGIVRSWDLSPMKTKEGTMPVAAVNRVGSSMSKASFTLANEKLRMCVNR